MKRSIVSALVCAALLLGACGLAWAHDDAPVLNRIIKNGVVRVGTSGNQPPFTMKSKTGRLTGYEVELAELLANAMGVELLLVEKPFPELLPALEAGEVDMVMSGMSITPERNVKVAFVGPYIVSGKSILSTSSTLLAAIDAEGAFKQEDLTVTTLEGSTSQRFVEKMLPKSKLVTTDDYDASVKLLLDGKADAMVADTPICALSMLRHPEANLGTLTRPLTLEPIGVALPSGDSLLINLLENYLDALEVIGVLDKLEEQWFQDATWLMQIAWP